MYRTLTNRVRLRCCLLLSSFIFRWICVRPSHQTLPLVTGEKGLILTFLSLWHRSTQNDDLHRRMWRKPSILFDELLPLSTNTNMVASICSHQIPSQDHKIIDRSIDTSTSFVAYHSKRFSYSSTRSSKETVLYISSWSSLWSFPSSLPDLSMPSPHGPWVVRPWSRRHCTPPVNYPCRNVLPLPIRRSVTHQSRYPSRWWLNGNVIWWRTWWSIRIIGYRWMWRYYVP